MFPTWLLSLAVAIQAAAMPSNAATPQLNADEIIERHIEARGGAEAMRAIDNLIFDNGVYAEADFTSDGSSVMILARPHYKLVGHPERDPGYMEGYDGAAWEWFADPGLVLRTVGAPSEAIRHFADVEGPFLDYADKGHRVALIGEAMIDDRPTYHIRLTMMDGYQSDRFMDQDTFLTVATRHVAAFHAFGEEIFSETRLGDYRPVNGVLYAHRFDETRIAAGELISSMQWGEIRANQDIPVAWFSPPEFERTRLQSFMDQLFVQRSDVQAVLWTYHRFRRAYPDESTREAAQIIGFHMLKMGDWETAIALLEQNAVDYPDAADSAFGLGRAYATAGRPEPARAAFERALSLDPEHARSIRALAALDETTE